MLLQKLRETTSNNELNCVGMLRSTENEAADVWTLRLRFEAQPWVMSINGTPSSSQETEVNVGLKSHSGAVERPCISHDIVLQSQV